MLSLRTEQVFTSTGMPALTLPESIFVWQYVVATVLFFGLKRVFKLHFSFSSSVDSKVVRFLRRSDVDSYQIDGGFWEPVKKVEGHRGPTP